MKIDDFIRLSRKKKTTIEDICNKLYNAVREFESKREEEYLAEFKKNAKQNPSLYDLNDIDFYANEITDKIKQDVKVFAKNYSDELIDQLLDAINCGTIEKSTGNIFLAITSALGSLERP
jgi:hypothetical protein